VNPQHFGRDPADKTRHPDPIRINPEIKI